MCAAAVAVASGAKTGSSRTPRPRLVISVVEPVIGWRLWRLRESTLHSWGVNHDWRPGINDARCLASGAAACTSSPGLRCQCGFWALLDPLQCLRRAGSQTRDRYLVMGMVQGWGEVAIHSNEGFRAQHARVLCLFSNWFWPDSPSQTTRHPWWQGAWSTFLGGPERLPPLPDRAEQLGQVAEVYGVPLVSLRHALDVGLLEEYGVDQAARILVRAWTGDAA